MADLFHDKADEYDTRPVPQQISEGVFTAMRDAVDIRGTVMDFGAGTGLVASKVAPMADAILAVDVSPAMLAKLAEKPELAGKVEVFCQDILEAPLDRDADLIVSAMAAHHVEDTAGLMRALFAHLRPGGQLALADLDAEDGTFHPPDIEGVFHAGFEREALASLAREAGFADPTFVTACEVDRDGRRYPIFLLTATRPAA
ncbi:MAG: class I SAM-dependent methyltransferase [Deltaproteobacteria bacterium]|nr:MAG: class I SAM-dependent methyltransferase [Deltaproteobacteria bacterium]